jgi:hypothetical protein
MQKNDRITRRRALALAAAGAAVTAAVPGDALAKKGPRREPVRFDDPVWNREQLARLEGDLAPGKWVNGYVTGVVCGVRDDEPVKPLFGFEVYSATRVLKQDDGSYQRLCRELIFYRNNETGELMDEWTNAYTGEHVKVVDVANDPYNFKISEWMQGPPTQGGMNKAEAPKRVPLKLNWGVMGNNVTLTRDVHLYYPNKLDPEVWKRESAGKMNRVSELFRWVIRREDIENPDLTHLPYTGVWSRITPWLPWMLMGQAPGFIYYKGLFCTTRGFDGVPKDVEERVRSRYPQYMVAPEKWVDPSYSSLENYARFQKPAPPRSDAK